MGAAGAWRVSTRGHVTPCCVSPLLFYPHLKLIYFRSLQETLHGHLNTGGKGTCEYLCLSELFTQYFRIREILVIYKYLAESGRVSARARVCVTQSRNNQSVD